jgi:hypothetical protein
VQPRKIDSVKITVRRGAALSEPTSLTISAGDVSRSFEPDWDGTGTAVLELPAVSTSFVTVRIDATDGATTVDRRTGERTELPVAISEIDLTSDRQVAFPAQIDTGCRADLVRIDGRPIGIRLTGDTDRILAGHPFTVSGCSLDGAPQTITVGGGRHRITTASTQHTGIGIDRIILDDGTRAAPSTPASHPTLTVEREARGTRSVTIGPCPQGCWLVSGEGVNSGWRATVDGPDGGNLGAAVPIDGGMGGWWLEPFSGERAIAISWHPQRWIWVGLGASLCAVAACAVLMLAGSRRRSPEALAAAATDWSPTFRALVPARVIPGSVIPGSVIPAQGAASWWRAPVAAGVAAAVVIEPRWAIPVFVVVAAAHRLHRPEISGWVGLFMVSYVALSYVWRQGRHRYAPGFGWVINIDDLNRITLAGLLLVLVAVITTPDSRR